MAPKITVQLDGNEIRCLLEGMVLASEISPYNAYHLTKVAEKMDVAAKEIGEDWMGSNAKNLEMMRYPIKRVAITYYDKNPKKKPEAGQS